MDENSLSICLDARIVDGAFGGVQQVVVGLASGLAKLTDGDERYRFLVHSNAYEWLEPYLGGPCDVLAGPPAPTPKPKRLLRSLAAIPGMRAAYERFEPIPSADRLAPPVSDGLIESAGIDVMHFTLQGGFRTNVPSIYQPHDLQHVHLPQYFSRAVRAKRDARYRALCHQALFVCAMSRWGKDDLVSHFQLREEKVKVVPWAPVLEAYPTPTAEDLERVRTERRLPEAFVFFPSKTYPHKNHVGLLEAMALLRNRSGLVIPLVCSGAASGYYPEIVRRARQLKLESQFHFLGYVTPLELQCLYRLARGMVFPTLFEGWGLPLLEAFMAGVPTASSNATCLPGQAGDAALLFDPRDSEQMAQTLARLWTDDALRKRLVDRGRARAAEFTWDRTVRLFRAYYRLAGNRPLTAEDQALLTQPPLV